VLEDSDARVLIIDTKFLDRIGARRTSSGKWGTLNTRKAWNF
jgi:hypothetical protein